MKSYKALVKDKDTRTTSMIESDYNTLAEFKHDLKANGYSVLYASSSNKFEPGYRAYCIKKAGWNSIDDFNYVNGH